MARVLKISCKLPAGVVIASLRSSEDAAASVFDRFLETHRDLLGMSLSSRSSARLESNQPLMLTLEVPEGAEAATAEALRELLKDLGVGFVK